MRLIEPLGLLHGADAATAVTAGNARILGMGGAYAMARLIGDGPPHLVRAAELPPSWQALADRLATPPPPWAGLPDGVSVMGILNATPDSFSDGGDHFAPDAAIEAGRAMVAAGAGLLDIGGESTRPGSRPVPPAAEQARILPVLRGLADAGVPLSVDTRNAATMAAALEAGAAIVNDVSALAHDPDAAHLVAERGAPVVLMHMRGTPETMDSLAQYDDVAVEVTQELAARLDAAEAAGIRRDRIALDPGIGFAKTATQSREMLRRLGLLANLGCPVLVGISRKSLIGKLSGAEMPKQRGAGSLAAALLAITRGARIVRVHDVVDTIQGIRVWQALLA